MVVTDTGYKEVSQRHPAVTDMLSDKHVGSMNKLTALDARRKLVGSQKVHLSSQCKAPQSHECTILKILIKLILKKGKTQQGLRLTVQTHTQLTKGMLNTKQDSNLSTEG